jgi:hypothetical protein
VCCVGHCLSYPHPNYSADAAAVSVLYARGSFCYACQQPKAQAPAFGDAALQCDSRTHPAACRQICLRHLRPLSCWWGWGPGCMGTSLAAVQPPQIGWPPLIAYSDPAQMHCTVGTAHGTRSFTCQDTNYIALVYANHKHCRCLSQPWHIPAWNASRRPSPAAQEALPACGGAAWMGASPAAAAAPPALHPKQRAASGQTLHGAPASSPS